MSLAITHVLTICPKKRQLVRMTSPDGYELTLDQAREQAALVHLQQTFHRPTVVLIALKGGKS